MATTTKVSDSIGDLVTAGTSPVFTASFSSVLNTPQEFRKLVEVKSPSGLVDMFGRAYPRKVALWVHHFDDYGVVVEGTYEIVLARRALKKAGYLKADTVLWGYRPCGLAMAEPAVGVFGGPSGGRSAVAFYFDVSAGL